MARPVPGPKQSFNLPTGLARVLLHFLEHPSEIITADILEAIWKESGKPGDEMVTALQRMFSEDIIAMEHPIGYRFSPAVTRAEPNHLDTPHHDSTQDAVFIDNMAGTDFEIQFDPDFSPDEVKDLLTALSDYYRGCGGVGFELNFETEEATVAEPEYA